MANVKTNKDQTLLITLKGHVSGTDGGGASAPRNMTGTLDSGPAGAVVSYPSGSLASLSLGNIIAPSGSVLIQLPVGRADKSVAQTEYWDVAMEISASDPHMSALSGIGMYRAMPIAHVSVSGAYLFAFQRLSGSISSVDAYGVSGSFIYDVPVDKANPSAMALEWSALIVGRKTTRKY